MKREKVVITGMGLVSPIGDSPEEFFRNAVNKTSGVIKNCRFHIPENISAMNGLVNDIESKCSNLNFNQKLSRIDKFSYVAVLEALRQADLLNSQNKIKFKDTPVYFATAIANIIEMETALKNGIQGNCESEKSYLEFDYAFQFNSVADRIKQIFGSEGQSCTIVTGCTGGNDALGYAMKQIQYGKSELVITGSVDCPMTPFTIGAFSKIGATSSIPSETASRPFDATRNGFVLSEGCGALILESETHAKKRGAGILAELSGYGSCNNGEHMTNINETGQFIAESILKAMENANMNESEIDMVNVHGSSTKQNDLAEANAIKLIFKKRALDIPVTSTKSLIGHPLSASNSIEIISSIMTLNTGIIQPTINLVQKDKNCDINIITDANKEGQYQIRCILKLSSGFSGIHSSLILRKYDEENLVKEEDI